MMASLKSNLRRVAQFTGFIHPYRHLKRTYQRVIGLRHPILDMKLPSDLKLIKLGSLNCGWTLMDDPKLQNSVVICAGLGEDGSFDVELAANFSATVHIVDPTPRAIEHFSSISERFGKPRERVYSEGGKQPAEAYDLLGVKADQLHLHQVALWNEKSKVKFFLPKNETHVSHSLVNFQHDYSLNTPFIEVDAVPLSELIAKIDVLPTDVALLKLDIEGAEIEVLEQMLSEGCKPRQILVEFDEINIPTKRGVQRVEKTYQLLKENGYLLAFTDRQADFLFIHSRSLSS